VWDRSRLLPPKDQRLVVSAVFHKQTDFFPPLVPDGHLSLVSLSRRQSARPCWVLFSSRNSSPETFPNSGRIPRLLLFSLIFFWENRAVISPGRWDIYVFLSQTTRFFLAGGSPHFPPSSCELSPFFPIPSPEEDDIDVLLRDFLSDRPLFQAPLPVEWLKFLQRG